MKKKSRSQNYQGYLKLDSLLKAQELLSDKVGKHAHDEMLFIITHQVYELWFKQIIFEIDSILDAFDRENIDESHVGIVVSRLERVNEIQRLLIDQIKVLETMTPMDFLDFRDLLTPASGFQSAQFRLIENKIGLLQERRHKYGDTDYKSKISDSDLIEVTKSETSRSIFTLVEQWLERTPFLVFDDFNFWDQYQNAVERMVKSDREIINANKQLTDSEKSNYLQQYNVTEKMFNALFDESMYTKRLNNGEMRLSYKATHAALLIFLYRDQPILHNPYKLLSRIIDLDELLTTWRYKHHLMVTRMIGRKIGTGGSVGAAYLNQTAEKHRVFEDLTSLTTFLIPRSDLPELPDYILRNLSFYYNNKD